jgi:hypothetical protein
MCTVHMCVYIRQYISRIYRHTQYMPFHFSDISENGLYIYAFTRAAVAAALAAAHRCAAR